MYSIFNAVENKHLGIFNQDEFIYKVRQIAVENEDEELSITCLGEAKDYLREYCRNLEFAEIIDMNKNQHLMSIRSNGQEMGHIEAEDGRIVTSGLIGNNTYNNFVELIRGLQGFDLKIDDFFF